MHSDNIAGLVLVIALVSGLAFIVYKAPQWNEEAGQHTARRCQVAFQMADSQHDTLLVVTASNGECTLTMETTNETTR